MSYAILDKVFSTGASAYLSQLAQSASQTITATSVDSRGGGDENDASNNWTTPEYSLVADGQFAISTNDSNWMVNPGSIDWAYNGFSIPSDATISSMAISVLLYYSIANDDSNQVTLQPLVNGSLVGSPITVTVETTAPPPAWQTFDLSSFLPYVSVAEINSGDIGTFAVRLSMIDVDGQSDYDEIFIDSNKLTVSW